MFDPLAGIDNVDRGRLAGSSVLIAGAGNIGSPLAGFLARAGVRLVRIVDRDRVEAKNVRTQDYRPEDVGRFKADVLAERLAQVPGILVESRPVDLEDLPLGDARVDVVLGALDSRRARQVLVSEIAWPLGVPVVDGGVGEGLRGRVQVFVPRPGAACLECGWGSEDYRQLAVEFPCVPGGTVEAPPTVSPAFLGAAIAAQMAAEALRLLVLPAPADSQEIAVDLFHRRHLVSRLRHNPRCRFDHQVVGRLVPLGIPFDSATAAHLLARAETEAARQPFHLEWRRHESGTDGFAGTRLVSSDRLRRSAERGLVALGFCDRDLVRVRTAGEGCYLALGAD